MKHILPYIQLMRLTKPIGIWLLFFPAAWGVLLAQPTIDWGLLALMLLGASVTRSAGCIINDLTDRTLDAKVTRTKLRPLAAGTVAVSHAYVLLTLLAIIALMIALSLPRPVFYVALLAVPMIVAYPWMKRITFWPQVFLGLTFNLGALMGWLATGNPLTPTAYLLYAACVLWTLGYDTIYALQDVKDDARVGIKSTARALGRHTPRFANGCYAAMMGLWMAIGWTQGMGIAYAIGLIVAFAHMRWQILTLAYGESGQGGRVFTSNQWLGLLILLGILLERV